MRPIDITVTSSNSPKVIPLDPRSGSIGLGCTPNSATYTVEFTHDNVQEKASGDVNWFSDASASNTLTNQTSAVYKKIGPWSAIKITLNLGTDVDISISQEDD